MKLIEYLSKMPLAKIVQLIGPDVVRGLQEFGLAKSSKEMAKILYEMRGNEIFKTEGLLKSLIWTLEKNDLEELGNYINIEPNSNFENIREFLLGKQFGENVFGRSILKFFNIDDDNFIKTKNIYLTDSEVINPRLSQNETSFNGQDIFIPEMYPLHAYQKATKDEIIDRLIKKGSKLILHMPTGSGKTKTAAEAIVDFWRIKGKRLGFIVWFAHTRELCEQAYETMRNTWQAKGDFALNFFKVFGDSTPNIYGFDSGILFIGFQKFYSLYNSNSEISLRLKDYTRLIVIDEAHKSIANTYKSSIIYIRSPDTRMLGLTATPGRTTRGDQSSNIELSSFYGHNKANTCDDTGNEMIDPIKYLQDNKYLAKLKRIKVDSEIEFSDDEVRSISDNIKLENSNLPKDILSKLTTDNIRNAKIINEIEEAVYTRKDPTLVFSTSIAHSVLLKVLLTQRGIRAECVLSNTPSGQRDEYISEFKNNILPVLINYEVLTMGFDSPNIRTLVISRPTTSIILYSQMLGRALRGPKMGGISEANTLIDIIDNYGEFGTERAAFNYFDEYYN